MWTFTIGQSGGLSQSLIDMVMDVLEDAADYWGRYIDFGIATLDIEINFISLGDDVLAQAGPEFFFDRVGPGGADVYQAGPILELQTGSDPNGADPDIFVDVNLDALNAGEFHLGGLDDSNIGSDEFDLFTVLMHELGHGLGILSFEEGPGGDVSEYELFVSANGFSFTGANAVATFGGNVPLAGDESHINADISDLMNAFLPSDTRIFVSALDVAIIQDVGAPLPVPTDFDDHLYGFMQHFDGLLYIGGHDQVSLLEGDDWYDGLNGDDTILGGEGSDTLIGGAGADHIDGGPGLDFVSYETSPGGNLVDMRHNTYNGVHATGDFLISIEGLIGSAFNDTLNGTAGDSILYGEEGDDALVGREGNDLLFGGNGDDYLSGGADADTLDGGAGADTHDGGDDIDTVTYAAATAAVSVNLSTGLGENDIASNDVLYDIENLIGSSFSDLLTGDVGPNQLDGLGGEDILIGLDGADTLSGGFGNDTLDGGAGDDTIGGEAGRDSILGGDGADTLHGFGSHDSLLGGNGNDDLRGGFGRDLLNGSSGNDILRGFEGDDRLFGGGGADTLLGNDGNDSLTGGGGVDRLKGDAGDDTLNGRFGDDLVTGGAGDDLFEFRQSHGNDTYDDFVAGAGTDDAIELIAFGTAFDTFAEVIAAASDNGNHTTIDFGGGDSILLLNVVVADLHEDDFLFS